MANFNQNAPYEVRRAHFIERAKAIWGDAFDYTDMQFTTGKEPCVITCRKHGPIRIGMAQNHILKDPRFRTGCPFCKEKQTGIARNEAQVAKRAKEEAQRKARKAERERKAELRRQEKEQKQVDMAFYVSFHGYDTSKMTDLQIAQHYASIKGRETLAPIIDARRAARRAERERKKQEQERQKNLIRLQKEELQKQIDAQHLKDRQREAEQKLAEDAQKHIAQKEFEDYQHKKNDTHQTLAEEMNDLIIDGSKIKDLSPRKKPHRTSVYISDKSARVFSLRYSYIKDPQQYLHSNLQGKLRIAARVATELWYIHNIRPEVNLYALSFSLSRLYLTYYQQLAQNSDNVLYQRLFSEDDEELSCKFIYAVWDFYALIPKDVKPELSDAGLIHFDKVFDMEEWCYTFDFLYPSQHNSKNKIELTCIYHGPVIKRKNDNFMCEQCMAEQQDQFERTQQLQMQAVRNSEREEFILKSRIVHGDKYDYSLVEYVSSGIPVNIRCIKHDYVFPMSPRDHLNGRGCKICAQNQKKTTEQFNEEMKEIFGGNIVCEEYITSAVSAKMYCKKHDHHFKRMPGHLQKGYGCPHCNKEEGKTWANTVTAKYDPSRKTERRTKQQFEEEARKRHGERFDYTCVKYVNNDRPVFIKCNSCQTFYLMSPDSHLRSPTGGCQKCYGRRGVSPEKKMQNYVMEANNIHNNRYIYLDKEYNPDKVNIYCHIHHEFSLKPQDHLKGLGCPYCFPKQSLRKGISEGERRIMKYLDKSNIQYIYNKEIENTYHISNRKKFRPDFLLPMHNVVIEFNGEQHYQYVAGIHSTYEDFMQQQLRDVELRRYCHDNNLRLLEIRYDEMDEINEIIKDFLQL